jgi:polyisoprenoid-binding protein YceI
MMRTLIASALAALSGLASAAPETYVIDPGHTVVAFEVMHFAMSTHRGHFQAKDGTVVLDRAARTGSADITIDTSTVSVGLPAFQATLKGDRFFNVTVNPAARFVGDSFNFDGDTLSSVAGTLTILGKSQPVTLKATRFSCFINPLNKREACGGDFETTIQRSQFGLGFGAAVAPDNVKLLIQVEGIKQVAAS